MYLALLIVVSHPAKNPPAMSMRAKSINDGKEKGTHPSSPKPISSSAILFFPILDPPPPLPSSPSPSSRFSTLLVLFVPNHFFVLSTTRLTSLRSESETGWVSSVSGMSSVVDERGVLGELDRKEAEVGEVESSSSLTLILKSPLRLEGPSSLSRG